MDRQNQEMPKEQEIDVTWIRGALIEKISREAMILHVSIAYHEPYQNTTGPIKKLELLISERFTRLYDQEKREINPDALQEGMVIDALIASKFSSSDKPMTEAFQILVVSSPLGSDAIEGKVLQVNVRNGNILLAPLNDPLQVLRIVVVEETVIINSQSRKIPLNNILPGMLIRVEHGGFFTSSTPPQTTATIIQVLEN